jgi:hypothetical protein
MGLIDRPLRAWINCHSCGKRRLVELHGVDVVGQFDPKEHATPGVVEFRGGAELFVQRLLHCVALAAQALSQFGNAFVEMGIAVFGKHHLLDGAGAGVLLERQDARHQLPWRDDIANPQSGSDRLRERTDVHDTAMLTHGV